jgi:DNA-binding transcriptional MerR regulator
MNVTYSIVLRRTIARGDALRLAEVAGLCNIHPDVIDRFVRLGLVDPAGRDEISNEWIFQPEVIPALRKIMRLRNELGINFAGIGVIVDLLSRIEQLEARIRDLEKQMLTFGDNP